MNLYFKDENRLNGQYLEINSSFFAITDRHPNIHGLCEEYSIIEKIRKNEDGFFDFSKSLIDIGAEDGNYAMLLDFDRNYCFEPNKRMCCLIHTNMYLKDKVKNTDVYNVALGEKDGEIMVFNGFAEKGSHIYNMSMNRCENGVEILNKKTLDSYNIRNVGLIKTDTEGFDYFVLKGAIHTIIENGYPPILFENWNVGHVGQTKEEHDRLFAFLESIGYTILEHYGDHETHLAIKEKK
jgi:FkbM family methyltransferase